MPNDHVYADFPVLRGLPHEQTSEESSDYNCFAWAAGVTTIRWDPNEPYYWPVERSSSQEALIAVFESIGYRRCSSRRLTKTFRKIALYSLDGVMTHAAVQLEDGMWSSKLGDGIDLKHTLVGLEGSTYGRVFQIMKRSSRK